MDTETQQKHAERIAAAGVFTITDPRTQPPHVEYFGPWNGERAGTLWDIVGGAGATSLVTVTERFLGRADDVTSDKRFLVIDASTGRDVLGMTGFAKIKAAAEPEIRILGTDAGRLVNLEQRSKDTLASLASVDPYTPGQPWIADDDRAMARELKAMEAGARKMIVLEMKEGDLQYERLAQAVVRQPTFLSGVTEPERAQIEGALLRRRNPNEVESHDMLIANMKVARLVLLYALRKVMSAGNLSMEDVNALSPKAFAALINETERIQNGDDVADPEDADAAALAAAAEPSLST